MEQRKKSYEDFLQNNKPYSSVDSDNLELYYEKVLTLVNNFRKAITEPKDLNKYFMELLMILDSKNITYKNRLIFLSEFQKHLDNENIIMGIIDALEKRQNLIDEYNMKFDLNQENLEIDMSLSVYIHKKHKNKSISEIYNARVNNFIYKYNVYSYCESIKNKLNNDKGLKDNCNKFKIYYDILESLDNYNEPKLDNFGPMKQDVDLT